MDNSPARLHLKTWSRHPFSSVGYEKVLAVLKGCLLDMASISHLHQAAQAKWLPVFSVLVLELL